MHTELRGGKVTDCLLGGFKTRDDLRSEMMMLILHSRIIKFFLIRPPTPALQPFLKDSRHHISAHTSGELKPEI